MTMEIQKLEHAAFAVRAGGITLAVDPGSLCSEATISRLTGLAGVLVTHRHGDHFHTKHLSRLATSVWGPPEVAELAACAGLRATALDCGVPTTIGPFSITAFPANHGPKISEPIENFGFVIAANGVRILATSDMAGYQSPVPVGPYDAVLLPVEGGGFVFDPREAVEFLRALGHHGVVVPMHCDEGATQPAEFATLAASFCRPQPLATGATLTLPA
jgi:L-ascorbate metabolism protein UlaG (beta-lactamase superfamily)